MLPATWRFLRDNGRWLGAGLVLTFASSFGQTFFIALFAEPIRGELGLGHAGWGTLYAAATLSSAVAIAVLGKLADLRPVTLPALGVIFALAAAALLMSQVQAVWLLAVAVFLLRFAGQGMAGHVAVTATARWFDRNRGRALAIAQLGHPAGEAILPGIVVALSLAIGWRSTWLVIAAVLVLAFAPLLTWLLAEERRPRTRTAGHGDGLVPGLAGRHWDRGEVLRHPLFWALLPGFLASPFMGTAVLFQSAPLMAAKGWSLQLYALAFPAYAAASVAAALGAGVLVDRFGAPRLLPFVLLPMAMALFIAAFAVPAWAVFAYLAGFGLTAGALFTVMNALWAELYGTRHLGAVRGVVSALMVFGTALGPGLTGVLLDLGVGLEAQLAGMGAVALGLAVSFTAISRTLARPAPSPA